MATLKLNGADTSSQTWRKVSDFLEAELVRLRIENDTNLNEQETADVRGQIRFCKSMLKAGEDRPEVLPASADDV